MCDASEVQRERWRKTAARRRRAQQDRAALIAGRCQVKRNGSGKICGQKIVLRPVRDAFGRVTHTEVVCSSCERRRAGVCQRCPRPVAGRRGFALYCDDAECMRIVRKAWRHGWDPRRAIA